MPAIRKPEVAAVSRQWWCFSSTVMRLAHTASSIKYSFSKRLVPIGGTILKEPYPPSLKWRLFSTFKTEFSCGFPWFYCILGHRQTIEYRAPHLSIIGQLLPLVILALEEQFQTAIVQANTKFGLVNYLPSHFTGYPPVQLYGSCSVLLLV